MATVYDVKIVSHWVNYTKEDLQKILEEALKKEEKKRRNEIGVEVLTRR